MKFAKVIQATGNNPKYFPKSSELDIIMVNNKGKVFTDDTFEFDTPILASKFELSKFNHFLDKLETGLEEGAIPSTCLNGTLTAKTLSVIHSLSVCGVFSR